MSVRERIYYCPWCGASFPTREEYAKHRDDCEARR
jgi:uncharacterized C2H2 Zn-finger protein